MQKKLFHITLCCLLITILSSCSIRRFVPEGKQFLEKNKVIIENTPVEFTKSEVSTYILQKPFETGWGQQFPLKTYYRAQRRPDSKFRQWMNRHAGKEPVYYEPAESERSTAQIEQYLNNRGYFNSKVTYETKTRRRKKHLLTATYRIQASEPYRISKIDYQIEDTAIARTLERLKPRYPSKVGDIYNSYTLDDQRALITDYLRNSGYYNFTKDYITYEVDSSFNNHTLKVTMKIANVKDRKTNESHPHKRYTINAINIYPDHSPFLANAQPTDSATITFASSFRNIPNSLNFYFYDKPYIRPKTFAQIIQIYKDRPYRQNQVSQTYSALSSLRIINNSSIEFDTVPSPNDTLNLLNCNIYLRRANFHSMKLQLESTNSGGDLGISGSVTYSHKNIFKGAEVLTLSVKGGVEAQKLNDLIPDNTQSAFNTRELIVSSSLSIPRFLSPIPLKTFVRDYQPKTSFSLGGSMQIHYAYSRYIAMGAFGYDWKANPRMQFIVSPFYLNLVKVNPIPEFQALLDQETNQRLKNQYTNHMIFGGRYSFIYNTQRINNKSNSYIYLRGNLESSGLVVSMFNKTSLLAENENHHELFGIRYAQFFRGDIDFRQYINLGEKTWLVFRQLVGAGIPYGNSYDMPFERSFYSGGATGLRGWDFRTLGPGGYVPPSDDSPYIERIGDLQLELNAELRFPVYKSFNGAIFVDAGNIWNYHANELLPNGEFHWNSFYNQIALDAGIGVRLDVNIVVIRLDMALPLRYPYVRENGSHWNFKDMDIFDLNTVINIGYPF